ncbi:Ser/Thr protein phosphatase [Colletotrichum higginsianum]|uniref:Ser/Thr protein phosphatase n=2 Tax=Colletotrichum higginsianum TaxID=80884 RepID=H1V8Z4_COLHI|nr:Ser/Thr protein phosphatase [Colletotrichum higginsianum IMI 349063]OBR03231.1 Ser/Thr protein phosphatase [Colletotrichum higginsianum IMI 349063]TIC89955.1 Uncharacterized protein CH35J_012336 [Colletotrichum higginsianum]CCF36697.1 Ser/Thr protein phosphatase [Colletotrichum higginsianum]
MAAFARRVSKLLRLSPCARIQILSDLHLEVGQQYSSYSFPASAPLLLLGGDVGRLADYDGYLRFLEAQTCRYQKVFLVLGNHEFYGLDYDSGVSEARRLSGESSLSNRLVLLHETRWDDPDSPLTILGCTLWSAIPETAHLVVESKVADFKKISDWSVQRHNQLHAEEAAWLRQQVEQMERQGGNPARRLLVATHHAPCTEGTSRPEHSRNPWTSAFATDLLDHGDWTGVKTWVFGHTHYSVDFVKNDIRLVANQRGYVLPGSIVVQGNRGNSTKRAANEFDDSFTIKM